MRDLRTRTTTLVSRASGASGRGGDDHSSSPVLSAGGRYVAFTSRARNLVPGVADGRHHVYVRDLRRHRTTLVDAPLERGLEAAGFVSSISADGRRVVFRSSATNLVAAPTVATTSIYLRDLRTSRTTLVSRADGPDGAPADSGSGGGAISADGRRVAFTSQAGNLSAAAGARISVFVRDVEAGTTTLASRADGPDGAGADGNSRDPDLSRDGRYVAFSSDAGNLSDADGAGSDVFVRDLATGATRLASRAAGPNGSEHPGPAHSPRLAAAGRVVFFASVGPVRDGGAVRMGIFRRDLLGGRALPAQAPIAPGTEVAEPARDRLG